MKTSFQKTLIAASVGVAMFAAVGTASANSLLFPYFTTASGAQSALSIASNDAAAATEALHYVYNYGADCTHYDGSGSLTKNDLMQHSVASQAAGGYGKAVGTDGSKPFYFPLPNSFGFMTVTSKSAGDIITGDMAIVDPSTGLVVSYGGITNNGAGEGDYSGIKDGFFNLTNYGSGLVDTSWYGVVAGDMGPAITGNRNWTGKVSLDNNGLVYDNDEQALSGQASKTLTCAGKFTATDLMNDAQKSAVGVNGSLIHATAFTLKGTNVADVSTGLVLSKMQVVKAAVGAPFAGKMFLHREVAATAVPAPAAP